MKTWDDDMDLPVGAVVYSRVRKRWERQCARCGIYFWIRPPDHPKHAEHDECRDCRPWLCKNGHDKHLFGVTRYGKCKECLWPGGKPKSARKTRGRTLTDGKWLCKRGHDKNVVGVHADASCKQCKRERYTKKEVTK